MSEEKQGRSVFSKKNQERDCIERPTTLGLNDGNSREKQGPKAYLSPEYCFFGVIANFLWPATPSD